MEIQSESPLGSPYQLEKFMKHTMADTDYKIQSVFSSPSTEAYADYIINSALSGSIEFDSRGRKNIIYTAGTPVGFQYINGVLQYPQDCVKIVCSTETTKIHAFPQSSTQFTTAMCSICSAPIIH